MPLNPTQTSNGKVLTFQYDEDGAYEWAAMLKYMDRKLPNSGNVNPCGGLVDVITGDDGSVRQLQFRNREPGDDTVYHGMTPKVYNGESWVPVTEYVDKKHGDWAAKTSPGERVAGYIPDMDDGSHHTGKFPPSAYYTML